MKRLNDNVIGQQQRAEHFRSPGHFRQGRPGVQGGGRPDGAFQKGAAIEANARCLGKMRQLQCTVNTTGFSNLQSKGATKAAADEILPIASILYGFVGEHGDIETVR